MRTFQVLMLTLCLVGGLHLVLEAPEFFMPDRSDPVFGRQFGATASRILGAGLLAMAALALIFLRHHYYSVERHLPGQRMQRVYFGLVVLALGLISLAFNLAEPGPDPARTPPASRTDAR
ncbi:MAG: hypothetical protein Q7J47_19255 [Azoarcus sp.]|nr:hypothetical protein [Azoarcus sp.]